MMCVVFDATRLIDAKFSIRIDGIDRMIVCLRLQALIYYGNRVCLQSNTLHTQ